MEEKVGLGAFPYFLRRSVFSEEYLLLSDPSSSVTFAASASLAWSARKSFMEGR